MTCLAIASMTALFIGLLFANSRDKHEQQEQEPAVEQTESGKHSEQLAGVRSRGTKYQL